MNLALWLERSSRRFAARPALMSGMEVLADYAGFYARAAGFAGWLRGQGIEPGARVALLMKNCPEYLIAMFGTWIAGAVVVPINAKLHPREVAVIVNDCGAQLACVTNGMDTGVAGLPEIDAQSPAFVAACTGPTLPVTSLGAEALAWLFYTSGTTGRPKGVMLSHGMLTSMALCYGVDVDPVSADDAHYYAAPMSHGAGLYALPYTLHGAAHLCPPSGGFDSRETLELAQAHGRLCMFLAPTMVQRLTSAARAAGIGGDGVQTVVYGGGPMYLADISAALDRFGAKFVQIYGQGECPMGITALPRAEIAARDHPDWQARIASVGRAQTAVEVAIHDDQGNTLPTGQVGEIVVRGLTVMQGYWQAPEATARAIRNGWLLTGDRGFVDRTGHVTLKDRSKDVIISGGSNIYPREVEEAILSHPAVAEVSVVGRHSAEWGEDVVAFVVAKTPGGVSAAELDAHCTGLIARFKRPKLFHFIDSLPKNNYGKVLKTELRRRC
ncbi:MAG: AMP-binding protein [Rhodobacteraceae bacterium]|nr:AMP-binding protein [Paracoccaceae bacterium]